MSKKDTKTISQFEVSEETSKALRKMAIDQERKVGEIVREIVEEYVARQHRPQGRGR